MPTGIYKRKPMSKQTKDKISKALKNKPKSKEHKTKISNKLKGIAPVCSGIKGITPWNKGLTKDNDNRINYKRPTLFKKGMIPWNKGIKGLTPTNKTSFKKGHTASPFKGKHLPLEIRKRISMTLTGTSEFTGFKKSESNKIRRSEEYKEWRTNVFKRNDYTCQITNIKGGNLVVHHLEGFNINKKLRLHIDNGITLCKKIHIKFHKKYGYRNNTLEQFNIFREEIKNGYD